jgi:hypothetical protein
MTSTVSKQVRAYLTFLKNSCKKEWNPVAHTLEENDRMLPKLGQGRCIAKESIRELRLAAGRCCGLMNEPHKICK